MKVSTRFSWGFSLIKGKTNLRDWKWVCCKNSGKYNFFIRL